MIKEMPVINVPQWLVDIARDPSSGDRAFPLRDILKESLYYPACGLDGVPIMNLTGNVYSFVYADYLTKKHEFLEDIHGNEREKGCDGYSIIFEREIMRNDIVPDSWYPTIMPKDATDIRRLNQHQKHSHPFGHWSVWKRDDGLYESHGAELFSLFYLAGEMNALYQGLYIRHKIAPKILAIIQPGAIGGEWECVPSDESFFKTVVKANPAGMPEYLVYGGYGNPARKRSDYSNACWSEYKGEPIAVLKGGRDACVFKRISLLK